MPDTAASLVERFVFAPGEVITEVSRRGSELLVSSDRAMWRVREVPPREFVLPEGSPRIFEAQRHLPGALTRVRGIAMLPGGRSFHLNDETGFAGFLGATEPRPDPLALAMLLARYRAPELLGEWPVELVTDEAQLDPGLPPGAPLELVADADVVEFTTQFRSPTEGGAVLLGLDRWRVSLRDGLAAEIEELGRALVPRR
jgi:hypothetical protein